MTDQSNSSEELSGKPQADSGNTAKLVAAGIGSAALVAALLYAGRTLTKKPPTPPVSPPETD